MKIAKTASTIRWAGSLTSSRSFSVISKNIYPKLERRTIWDGQEGSSNKGVWI